MDSIGYDPAPEASAKFEEETKRAEEDAKIVELAKAFYASGIAASSDWRTSAIDDLEFLAGRQWDPVIKGNRDSSGRPALTVNRLPQFVRQVTNEQRQSKPAVTVNPVDDSSDVRTAEVLQGVIRNIEASSNADAAYAAGGQSAAITGLGYWDVGAEFENERSFEQRLVIRRIKNPMSVVMDPAAKEVAGDDARQVIISTDLSEGEWNSKFGDKEIPKGSEWKGEGDSAADWVAKDGVRLHEYRYVKDEPDTLIDVSGLPSELATMLMQLGADLSSGAVLASEIGEDWAKHLIALVGEKGWRDTSRRKACWVKIAGDEIVERGEFAGDYLQLVRVVGAELDIDGETIYEGVIRHAKDSQRMLNYFVSSEAEAIALTPKAPWLGTAKQFEGYTDVWSTANTKTHSYLVFNPDPQNPGPPQRVMAEANVQAITNARMQAADDLKATTGIYDGQLGARSNETSGRAILARQNQGQTANFHFQDNLGMAIRYTGRILVDLIPKIYAGPRVLRILGEDGKPEMVPVNGQPGDLPGKLGATPDPIHLNAGRYDVTVSMGPSYQSRRQEAAAQLLELIRVNPSISQVAGDLLVKSMDIPGGKEIAERIQKLLPPEIRPPDDKQPPAAQLAQQLQQSQQMIEQMTEQLHSLSTQIETNAQDNAAKKEIELTKLHAQVLMKLAEIDSAESIAILKAEAVSIGNQRRASEAQAQQQQQQQPMPGASIEGGPNNGF